MRAIIVGAGLAGSEAAWLLANSGVQVDLYEMRPEVVTKAHHSGRCAELVCSNSFRGAALTNAVGLLKAELRALGSLIMQAADATCVPAGGALAVDRDLFSAYIDDLIRSHPRITLHTGEVTSIPSASAQTPVIIATGPLTSRALSSAIESLIGTHSLAFFDAISPIIHGSSIDFSKLYRASRYGKGGGDDYWNIPLDQTQYQEFITAVSAAEKYGGKEEVEADRVADLRPFEGCMPIEEMVARGDQTLRFGPLKPVGLRHPATGKTPYAVIQLRQDNREGTLWSMVGFQTRMRHGEQLRIFKSLPGLAEADFVRLGSVHRNTFLNSPRCLDATGQFRTIPGLFFAGQLTGVEGYVESTASGYCAAMNALRLLKGEELFRFPTWTAVGALQHYISDPERQGFQPMNISFGLIPEYAGVGRDKNDRRLEIGQRSLAYLATLGADQAGASQENSST